MERPLTIGLFALLGLSFVALAADLAVLRPVMAARVETYVVTKGPLDVWAEPRANARRRMELSDGTTFRLTRRRGGNRYVFVVLAMEASGWVETSELRERAARR